jgi:type VI secretion system VasD/TssJ family lipoprotein
MNRITLTISSILLVSLVSSCCSKSSIVSPPEWKLEKDAVTLRFEGDQSLNLYQGKPHSLIVCVYHLTDLNGFKQLTDESGGLSKLLECGRFAASVTYSKRLVVQPGQDLKESLDRTEGAKYVGIVAGYYSLHKVHSVRSYQIPVSMFNNPKKLDINLHLGPEGIQEIKEK